MTQAIDKSTYLKKDFDYTKLTKDQLRGIMFENGVENIPPITELKSAFLRVYKKEIHTRIDELSKPVKADGSDIKNVPNFSTENPFQSPRRKSDGTKDTQGTPAKSDGKSAAERGIDMSTGRASNVKINLRKSPIRDTTQAKSPVRGAKTQTTPMRGNIESPTKGPSLSKSTPKAETPKVQPKRSSPFVQSSPQTSKPKKPSENTIARKAPPSGVDKRKPAAQAADARKGAASKKEDLSTDTADEQRGAQDQSYLVKTPSRIKKLNFESPVIEKGSWREVLVYILLALYVYFRFICPYCTDGKILCMPAPKNAYIEGGSLKCNPGFVFRRGLVNKCETEAISQLRSGEEVTMVKLSPDAVTEVVETRGVQVNSGVAKMQESVLDMMIRYLGRFFVVFEIPILASIFVLSVRSHQKRRHRIKVAIEREGRRSVDQIAKVLKEKSTEGKVVPVSTIKKQFGNDRRLWDAILRNIKAKVVERNGVVDGKQTRVWEWSGKA